MKNFSIRPIGPGDNEGIAAIIRRILKEFGADRPGTVYFDPATDHLYESFTIEKSFYFIAECEGKIVGGSGVYPTTGLPEDCCELVKLYLLPEMRGQGFGLMLMEKCFQKAIDFGYRSIYLETMPELSSAIGLYEKSGFTYLTGPMGNSGHYGCALWMIKNL